MVEVLVEKFPADYKTLMSNHNSIPLGNLLRFPIHFQETLEKPKSNN